jgi:hypothetical protein
MPVTFANFKVKYPTFGTLPETQFNLHLPDAIAAVEDYNWQLLGPRWQIFKDKAIELLLACTLSSANPEFLGAAGLKSFEVREAGYKVEYKGDKEASKVVNPYCAEYQQLIDKLEGLTPDSSRLPANTKGVLKQFFW